MLSARVELAKLARVKVPEGAWSPEREWERVYTIDAAELVGAPMVDGPSALSAVVDVLRASVEKKGLPAPRYGRIWSNRAQSEVGIFLDEGSRDGAVVSLRCERLAAHVEVRVARSSKVLRGGVWGSFAVCIVLSFFLVLSLAPRSIDPGARFFGALSLAVASWVGAILLVVKSGRLVGARSAVLAKKLDKRVNKALVSAFGAGESPSDDDEA